MLKKKDLSNFVIECQFLYWTKNKSIKVELSNKTIKYLVAFLLFCCFVRADAQNQGPPPTMLYVIGGIRISKSHLMAEVTKFDSTMIFKQNPDIDGLSNLVATDNLRGALQIVGGETNVVLAKWTFSFGDKNVNLAGLTNMGHFAFIVAGQPCVDWLVGKIKAATKDYYRGFDENRVFSSDVINGNINYDPTSFKLTLSFKLFRSAN